METDNKIKVKMDCEMFVELSQKEYEKLIDSLINNEGKTNLFDISFKPVWCYSKDLTFHGITGFVNKLQVKEGWNTTWEKES